jgi:hypothetical protein
LKKIRHIDLATNQFESLFPLCLTDLPELVLLNLGQNTIRGHIPDSIGHNLINVRRFLVRFDHPIVLNLLQQYDMLIGIYRNHVRGISRDLLWMRPNIYNRITEASIIRYLDEEHGKLAAQFSPAAAA